MLQTNWDPGQILRVHTMMKALAASALHTRKDHLMYCRLSIPLNPSMRVVNCAAHIGRSYVSRCVHFPSFHVCDYALGRVSKFRFPCHVSKLITTEFYPLLQIKHGCGIGLRRMWRQTVMSLSNCTIQMVAWVPTPWWGMGRKVNAPLRPNI